MRRAAPQAGPFPRSKRPPRRLPPKTSRALVGTIAQGPPKSCALDHCGPANLWQVNDAAAPKIASVCAASRAVPPQNLP